MEKINNRCRAESIKGFLSRESIAKGYQDTSHYSAWYILFPMYISNYMDLEL